MNNKETTPYSNCVLTSLDCVWEIAALKNWIKCDLNLLAAIELLTLICSLNLKSTKTKQKIRK